MTQQPDRAAIEVDKVVQYASWTEDQLFQELGRQLLGDGAGFGGEDLDRARRFARQWFEDRSAELRQEICAARSVQLFLQDGRADLFAEAAAALDALQALRGHPAVSYLAAIIVRRGLQALCAGTS